MPKIDTLIADIQEVLSNPQKILNEIDVSDFGKALAKKLTLRLTEDRGAPTLRMSNLGTKCRRKLWYSINKPELAEPLTPSTKLKFLFGDIIEEFIIFLAKAAGHKVEREQEQVEINGVLGHIDGVIDDCLVDVKSASSLSFDKFRVGIHEGNDSFGYVDQLGSYDFSLGESISGSAFLAVDKQHGNLTLDKHPRTTVDYTAKVEELKAVVARDRPPQRDFLDVPDGKSGNRKLDVYCSYCEFKTSCWPNLRVFGYAKGPTYLTHVSREPDVQEL